MLCHKAERQRVRVFDKHGRAGTSCLFLALVVLFVRDKAVPDIQQCIDERCGTGDRIGVDRSLAADRAQEVCERLIGGRAKERDGVEVQESAVVLTLPLVLFEAHKRRLGNRFFQQPNIRIVRGVFGAARRRYARIGEIQGRLQRDQKEQHAEIELSRKLSRRIGAEYEPVERREQKREIKDPEMEMLFRDQLFGKQNKEHHCRKAQENFARRKARKALQSLKREIKHEETEDKALSRGE